MNDSHQIITDELKAENTKLQLRPYCRMKEQQCLLSLVTLKKATDESIHFRSLQRTLAAALKKARRKKH